MKILKTLSHANIPKYLDNFEFDLDNERLYVMIQSYIKGNQLEEMIKRQTKFSFDEIIYIFAKLLNVLDYIHSLHPPLIHRDINSQNIPKDIDKQDSAGKTKLMQAIFDYEDEKSRILITQRADLNLKDKKGKAAIVYCIIYERFDIAELLVEKGADVNAKDKQGNDVTYYATTKKTKNILKKAGIRF